MILLLRCKLCSSHNSFLTIMTHLSISNSENTVLQVGILQMNIKAVYDPFHLTRFFY